MQGDGDLVRAVVTAPEDGTTTIELAGELDISNSAGVQAKLEALIHQGQRRLVLDLRELHFIDSTGLSTLASLHQLLRDAGGSLEVRGSQPHVFRVMEISGLLHVLGAERVTAAVEGGD